MQIDKRRNQRRRCDLRRAVQNRLLDLLPRFEIAVDVFDLHRRIVHQDADRQRETSQRHDVDRFPQRCQRRQRTKNRERDRYRDDQSRAPAAQEDQDHDRRQAGGNNRLAHHAVDCAAYKNRLVRKRIDFQLRRQLARDAGKLGANPGDNIQRRSRSHFQNTHEDGALAIDTHDVGLRRAAVAHVSHVAHINNRPVHCADGQIVQLLHNARRGVGFNRIFEAIDLRRPRWHDQILHRNRVHHIRR
jgi:hypothetical protein